MGSPKGPRRSERLHQRGRCHQVDLPFPELGDGISGEAYQDRFLKAGQDQQQQTAAIRKDGCCFHFYVLFLAQNFYWKHNYSVPDTFETARLLEQTPEPFEAKRA